VFYLGIHQPHWLTSTRVPLFVSRRRLVGRKTMPKATGRWALDSGAFTEIKDHGKWTVGAIAYAAEVRRIAAEVGNMDWASIQDWMCEPPMLLKTGKTIAEHQALTVQSYADLRRIAPEIPWIPVLQGWRKDDYLDHVEQYASAGFDLTECPTVGLGSVCRRQATDEFASIVRALVACGMTLHGFGVKTVGLQKVASLLQSSDSLAWSFTARRMQKPGLVQCIGGGHKNCANCLPFALAWRQRLLAKLPTTWQDNAATAAPSPVLTMEVTL
jgi:hypothetical protein